VGPARARRPRDATISNRLANPVFTRMNIVSTLWSTFLLPGVDILLIAFVFYRILLLIKGTASVQVVMGLAVLMGMTLVVRQLHLPAATWLLENFWSGAVVLLAVVFQPE